MGLYGKETWLLSYYAYIYTICLNKSEIFSASLVDVVLVVYEIRTYIKLIKITTTPTFQIF